MAPLALVANLTTRWHYLHKLQIWPPDGAICISCKFGHQMMPLALVADLPTRWYHLYCFQSWPPDCITCIATVGIDLVSSSARVTSVKSQQVAHSVTSGPKDRTPGLPGSDKNWEFVWKERITGSGRQMGLTWSEYETVSWKKNFLSDPGKPGVRSLGPDVTEYVQHLV